MKQAHTFLKLFTNMFLNVPEISREHVREHVPEIDLCVPEFVNMSLKILIVTFEEHPHTVMCDISRGSLYFELECC